MPSRCRKFIVSHYYTTHYSNIFNEWKIQQMVLMGFFFFFRRRMSEASIPKMKLMIAKLTKKLVETTVQSKNEPSDEDRTTDYDTDNDIKPNGMQKEYETLNRVYVNPMIAELKQTNVNLPFISPSTYCSNVVIR